MRITALLTGAVFLAFASGTPAEARSSYRVDLNKTEIVRLPVDAASVVIGNPNIADVTVQSVRTIFVVGRGFGETNLIILDRNGDTVMDADIQVVNSRPDHSVRIHRGQMRQTYSCIPYCQPSPVLGDDPEFIGGNTSSTPTNNAFTAGFGNAPSNGPDQGLAGPDNGPGPTQPPFGAAQPR